MTPTEIEHKARLMKTPKDLLDLINEIRLSSGHNGLQKIDMQQLSRFRNPKSEVVRYKNFTIPKKSGGQRCISAPVPKLKAILWPVKEILTSFYEPLSCVMGFTPCRSVVDNARLHLGQNYILNLDLKDFFPSVHQARVRKRLQVYPYNFPETIANILAGLCSVKMDENGLSNIVLPQGAPTSPILTNIICERLDRKLTALAAKYNLRYSRYADDMTFSSMHSVLSPNGKVYEEIIKIIVEEGFTVNEKKTRLQKRGARQEVTGLIVSGKVNTPERYIRELDILLYVWNKFGYERAFARLMEDRKNLPGGSTRNVSLESVIRGKLNYLKMVKGEKDKVYVRYRAMFESLRSMDRPSSGGVIYLATYPYAEFEKIFNTKVTVKLEEGKGMSASFVLGRTNHRLNLSSRAAGILKAGEKSILRNKLHVSLCQKGSILFWSCGCGKPKCDAIIKLTLPSRKLIEIWEKEGIQKAISAEEKAEWFAEQKKKDKDLIKKIVDELSSVVGLSINDSIFGINDQEEDAILGNIDDYE